MTLSRTQLQAIASIVNSYSMGKSTLVLLVGSNRIAMEGAVGQISDKSGLDLHRIDASEVVNKYIGETEKNLKKVFDSAVGSNVILFFDEADALFGKRTEASVVTNYLFQRMKRYPGISVLAIDSLSGIDRAFLRGFRFVVRFPRRRT